MIKAIKLVVEISRLREAQRKSESKYLKADYGKAIRRKKAQLRKYCADNEIDINEIIRRTAYAQIT